MTKATVKRNYRKLEQSGIITGATIHINYKSFGYKAVVHILINVDSKQADRLVESLQKMPEVYAVYNRGVKGNIDVVVALRTLEQLNEIKDVIKRNFSILDMKTAIWTDVKEMNNNLSISPCHESIIEKTNKSQTKTEKENTIQNIGIDQTDQKIADKLSENGRIPMGTLGKEIGTSAETAKRRYERLRQNGVLKVTIQINPIKIGYQALCVFFTVTSNENSLQTINEISRIPDIISIMKTTGDYDLQIYAMVQDIGQLLSINEELGNISGITKMDIEILRLGENLYKWPTPRQYISTF